MACLVALGWLVAVTPAALAQGTLSAIETDVDLILATTRPSVVSVVCIRNAPEGVRMDVPPSTRVGSGIAVSENEILTTATVVDHASQIWVRTSNRLQLQALHPRFSNVLEGVNDAPVRRQIRLLVVGGDEHPAPVHC